MLSSQDLGKIQTIGHSNQSALATVTIGSAGLPTRKFLCVCCTEAVLLMQGTMYPL